MASGSPGIVKADRAAEAWHHESPKRPRTSVNWSADPGPVSRAAATRSGRTGSGGRWAAPRSRRTRRVGHSGRLSRARLPIASVVSGRTVTNMKTTTNDSQPSLTDLAAQLLAANDPLVRLAALRSLRELLTVLEAEAVGAARSEGASWGEVGGTLGVSKQAAAKRFAPPKSSGSAASPPTRGSADRTRLRGANPDWEVTTPGGRTLLRLRKARPRS